MLDAAAVIGAGASMSALATLGAGSSLPGEGILFRFACAFSSLAFLSTSSRAFAVNSGVLVLRLVLVVAERVLRVERRELDGEARLNFAEDIVA